MVRTTRRKTADTSSSTASNAPIDAPKGGGRKGPAMNKRKRESIEGDDNDVKKVARKRKICSADGCTTQARPGFEVCIRHGAKVEHKRCSKEECNNFAVKGGVCIKHGAKQKRKRCSSDGCTKNAQKGGVCIKHGAKVTPKRCSNERCTNLAIRGGVCVKHGAKVKLCSEEGCPNQAKNGGVCKRHGAKVKRCSNGECNNIAVRG